MSEVDIRTREEKTSPNAYEGLGFKKEGSFRESKL